MTEITVPIIFPIKDERLNIHQHIRYFFSLFQLSHWELLNITPSVSD